jgi:hypothetical protein
VQHDWRSQKTDQIVDGGCPNEEAPSEVGQQEKKKKAKDAPSEVEQAIWKLRKQEEP